METWVEGIPSPSQVRRACRVRAILREYIFKHWDDGAPGSY